MRTRSDRRNVRMWRPWLLLAVALPCASFMAEERAQIPWLGENLVPNPGFENVLADGHTPGEWTAELIDGKTGAHTPVPAETDAAVYLEGRRSLRLAVPGTNTCLAISSAPIPVEGGAGYLYSVGLRGASIWPDVYWLDTNKTVLGHINPISCPPMPAWELRDVLVTAPANARLARLGFRLANTPDPDKGGDVPAPLWADAAQFRKYIPPPTPDWAKAETARLVEGATDMSGIIALFPGYGAWPASGGEGSCVVADSQAERGMVLQARTNAQSKLMVFGGASGSLPLGLYRVRARVKIPATREHGPVGRLNIGSTTLGSRVDLPFVPTAETAGKYTVVEGDFVVWDGGSLGWSLYTQGKEPWSIDSIKIFPLHELTDRELLAIYPGSVGAISADLKPATGDNGLKCLAVMGLGYDRYRIADVVHAFGGNSTVKVVWAKNDQRGMTFVGLPEDPGALFQYSIIYLCNINLRGLGLKYKQAIREYVRRGGALVVMGGQQGYERGGWRGSLIEEALPVESAPAGRGGLIRAPRGLSLKINGKMPWLEGISTASSPLTHYLHAVTVKPTGTVLVQAGDKPFLVTGAYGQGRVVCLLGVPWGAPKPTETPFWGWDDWVDLLREVCWWALKNPTG
ncbi:MAG: glutamine amidotransferase [Kiritimatiellae bacterium]|nr:glutamine amidotransferase [Kiritimatiellia bacterium]